jgi:hypothetical protein
LQLDAVDELGGGALGVEAEVMQVRLLEVSRQRADTKREGVPAPVDGPQRQ